MRRPTSRERNLPREPLRLAGRAVRQIVGTSLGLPLGAAMVLASLMLLATAGRWHAPLQRVRRWEQGRLRRWQRLRLGAQTPSPDGDAGGRGGGGDSPGAPEDLPLAALGPGRSLLHGLLAGVLGYVMLDLLLLVASTVLGSASQMLIGGPVVMVFDLWVISRPAIAVLLIFGTSSLIAAALYGELCSWLQATVLGRWIPVHREDALESRIGRLLTTRRGVVLAIDDERRRIERDLHDGVQQNVVSLSVALARARRASDPERSQQLLEQAHAQSQDLIEEVRQVAWRIYPTALDEHGLASALAGVAETCPLPVEITHELSEDPPPAVASAAYFVARECVTNVVKHARASRIRITLQEETGQRRRGLRLSVQDDGIGGADPEGGGLQGLARRVAALDGTVDVTSPLGGPTLITAEIPND